MGITRAATDLKWLRGKYLINKGIIFKLKIMPENPKDLVIGGYLNKKLIITAILLSLFGCEGLDTSFVQPEPAAITGETVPDTTAEGEIAVPARIMINPENEVIYQGEQVYYTAFGVYGFGIVKDITPYVTFFTNDAAKARFDGAKLEGIAQGDYEVRATYKGIEAVTPLKIEGVDLQRVFIDPTPDTLEITESSGGGFIPRELSFKSMGVYSDLTYGDLTESCSWSTSDEDTASFDESELGILTLKKAGEITISVKCGKRSTSHKISLLGAGKSLVDISFKNTSVAVPVGASVTVAVYATYNDQTEEDITESAEWLSSNEAIATIDNLTQKGKLTGVSDGSTFLTATFNGKTARVPVVTTVAILKEISISPKNVSVPLGNKLSFTAQGVYSDGMTYDITSSVVWGSSSTAAIISSTAPEYGRTTTNQVGDVIITGEFNGFVVSTQLIITEKEIISMELTPSKSSLAAGTTGAILAIANYSDGTTENITDTADWSVNNSTFLEVSNTLPNKGLITAKVQGTATITAVAGNWSANYPIVVTPPVIISLQIKSATGVFAVALGRTLNLSLEATMSDSSKANVTASALWTFDVNSAGYSFAGYVSNQLGTKGRFYTLKEGLVKVIAEMPSVAPISVDVAVTEKEIISLTVTALSVTEMDIGSTQQANATALYTDGTTLDVTDTTGDPDLTMVWSATGVNPIAQVATVNSSTGLITANSEGGSTIGAQLTSVKFGVLSHFRTLSVRSVCNNGKRNDFYCIYLSAYNESCAEVCTAAGGAYNQATNYYYGSSGQGYLCGGAFSALLGPSFTLDDGSASAHPSGEGLGCSLVDVFGDEVLVRYSSPSTSSTGRATNVRRVCACTN